MIAVSVWGGADTTTVDAVVARVDAAATEGFGSIWFPQTAGLDALTALAVAAVKVPGIRLGTAVVPIQGRHPIPLAQQALTVADAAGPGRFTLGVGVTHAVVSEGWYGVPYRDVVALCEEELEALDGLLSTRRQADVEGAYLTARLTLSVPVAPARAGGGGPRSQDAPPGRPVLRRDGDVDDRAQDAGGPGRPRRSPPPRPRPGGRRPG